jgi:hypothetical protein
VNLRGEVVLKRLVVFPGQQLILAYVSNFGGLPLGECEGIFTLYG